MGTAWRGVDSMVASVRGAKSRGMQGLERGVQLALKNTLNVSNKQVPHEVGDLERDGGTSTETTSTSVRGAVSYGRNATTADYAVPQHERLDFRHDSGRNAKFLERAQASTAAENRETIAQQVRQSIGG